LVELRLDHFLDPLLYGGGIRRDFVDPYAKKPPPLTGLIGRFGLEGHKTDALSNLGPGLDLAKTLVVEIDVFGYR